MHVLIPLDLLCAVDDCMPKSTSKASRVLLPEAHFEGLFCARVGIAIEIIFAKSIPVVCRVGTQLLLVCQQTSSCAGLLWFVFACVHSDQPGREWLDIAGGLDDYNTRLFNKYSTIQAIRLFYSTMPLSTCHDVNLAQLTIVLDAIV